VGLSSAEQARRHRQLRREGKRGLLIRVPEVELAEALRIAGFIDEHAPDPEPHELAVLLERLIETWCESTCGVD
jgi:hypothetical protein